MPSSACQTCARSEEHTSELQSHSHLVCRLLLEKKNNFWKGLAVHPPTLRRTWESLKEVMSPGALDLLVKEMISLAVSATNQCQYCIASHTAAARNKGMT